MAGKWSGFSSAKRKEKNLEATYEGPFQKGKQKTFLWRKVLLYFVPQFLLGEDFFKV